MCTRSAFVKVLSVFLVHYLIFSNEEDVTAVTDSNGNTLRIRRDTNRMPVRVVAPDNQVRQLNAVIYGPAINGNFAPSSGRKWGR